MQSVNLSASSFYVPSNNSMMYLNYGAAVSEVKCFLMHMSNLNGISSLKAIF
jgi:abscisic-aldehyde oxidase